MKTIARLFPALLLLSITFAACTNAPEKKADASAAAVSKQDFGQADGKPVYLYTLTNKKGDQVKNLYLWWRGNFLGFCR